MSVASTELTTPSLCSDDDGIRGETSPEDILPSTPPSLARGGNVDSQDRVGCTDIDRNHTPPQKSLSSQRMDDVLAKRPLSSPMLVDTPRKARPPARSLARLDPSPSLMAVIHGDNSIRGDDSDDDPLSLSYCSPPPSTVFSPEPESQAPSRGTSVTSSCVPEQSQRRGASLASMSNTNRNRGTRRRQTLDEELRLASNDDSDYDSGVLVGVGTSSKQKGFLAHGGAGGAPVFMGVGYVEGAVDDETMEQGWQVEKSRKASATDGKGTGKRRTRR
jgi:hypothetical protein